MNVSARQDSGMKDIPDADRFAWIPDSGRDGHSFVRRLGIWLLPLLLIGCASYGGNGLVPGTSTLAEVLATMGKPAMQWKNADQSVQLSYPRGPFGLQSFMVHVGAGGRLERIENVLAQPSFAKLKPDLTQDEVLRTIGPPIADWTMYFPARRELAWEWRYCNGRGVSSRFHVLFDSDTGRVRSTMSFDETCVEGGCICN